MKSNILIHICKFQIENNKSLKLIKFKNKKYLFILFVFTFLSFAFSIIFLKILSANNINLNTSVKVIFSELLTGLGAFIYIFKFYGKAIKAKKAAFINFINKSITIEQELLKDNLPSPHIYDINIQSLEDYKLYNFICYLYNKTGSNVDTYFFKDIYDLINISIDKHNYNDYLTPKYITIYGGIISLIVSLLTVILTDLKIYNLYILVFIFISLFIYNSYRSIVKPESYKHRQQLIDLKENLKKCEIEFISTNLISDKKYMDFINSIVKSTHKFN